jgi:hypothetical protein
MARIFALGAEFLAALYAEEHTIIAFRRFAKLAVAEMIPLGKVVTVPAPTLANLGHFAVCALLLGASRHEDLPKSRTMIFAKASTQAKDLRKLVDRHETSNRSSVQKAEYRTAHEICRKHLGEKHRGRRRMLLRLLSTPFRFHSCHADGDRFPDLSGVVALGDEIRSNASSPEKQEWRVKYRADTICCPRAMIQHL